MYVPCLGADPGFWIGRGTGSGSGRQTSISGVQGQSPGGCLGAKFEECYVVRLKNTCREKKNKSIQSDMP